MATNKPYRSYEALETELTEDGVLTVTLDRPERLNAFNGPLRRSIRSIIDDAAVDAEVRVFVLTGAGRGFCSGADLTAEDRSPVPVAPHDPAFAWCVDLLEMPKPTIAAVNGVAAGGGLGFALLCDIRICSTEAKLLPIWMKRAIHPDDLITWTLPRLVGLSRALH
ncbi:MAG: enoyl-CoA hydratase/isomerase family protein, partial [Actinomycetia bacterium]|nr:enoyl-CoA hydratase/isomerase family protein [Actinomycetes bacterium]